MRQGLTAFTDKDDEGKDRKYGFDCIMEAPKAIRENTVDFSGTEAKVISTPTPEQKEILDVLGIAL
jgi:hypothetical protein